MLVAQIDMPRHHYIILCIVHADFGMYNPRHYLLISCCDVNKDGCQLGVQGHSGKCLLEIALLNIPDLILDKSCSGDFIDKLLSALLLQMTKNTK